MICFGFGLGYQIEAILNLTRGKINLTSVEPDPSVLQIPEVKKKF